jgi:long-chain fatty acid transport protein
MMMIVEEFNKYLVAEECMKFKKLAIYVAIAVAGMSQTPVYATNGMLLTGYGFRSQGMGGVGIAYGRDSLSVAANPANATKSGMRGDMGVGIFNAERHVAVGADAGQTSPFNFHGSVESDNKYFIMPEMGFTMPLTEKLSVGLAFVPNGGGNTTFRENFFSYQSTPTAAQYPARDKTLGVDLMQLVAPITVAYKVNEDHSIGASLVLAAQRFRAYGLQAFPQFGTTVLSGQLLSDPNHLTDVGFDYSYGAGVRLGWQGEFLNDRLTLGLTYASKTYMTKFDKYRGLFAEQGKLDIPENYGIGIAIKPASNLTIAADIVRINYSDVGAIGNRGPGEPLSTGGIPSSSDPTVLLGMDKGMGFGWTNQTVYKLGINYGLNERWQLRAGYNYGKSPIPNDQLTFNTLAPATTEKHYSVGFTYKANDNLEVTGTYVYAAPHSQQAINQNILGGVQVDMHQNIFALSLGWVLDPGATDYGDAPSEPINFGSGDRGFYGGFGLGQARITSWKAADFNSDLTTALGYPATTGVDQRSMGFKAYLGYSFNKFFALEGGFADFNDVKGSSAITYKNYTNAGGIPGNPALQVLPGSSVYTAENDAWMLAFVGKLPLTEKISALAKLGASSWSSNYRVNYTRLNPTAGPQPLPQPSAATAALGNPYNPIAQSGSDRGVDLYYGLGVSYDLLDNIALRAEWERFKFGAPHVDHVDLMTAGVSMKF